MPARENPDPFPPHGDIETAMRRAYLRWMAALARNRVAAMIARCKLRIESRRQAKQPFAQ